MAWYRYASPLITATIRVPRHNTFGRDIDRTRMAKEIVEQQPDASDNRRGYCFCVKSVREFVMSQKCHVWTAPGWQGLSSRPQAGRCSHVFGLLMRFT